MERPRVGKLWLKHRYAGKTRHEVVALLHYKRTQPMILACALLTDENDLIFILLTYCAFLQFKIDKINQVIQSVHVTQERLYLNFHNVIESECPIDFRFKLSDLLRILKCFGLKDFYIDNGAIVKHY